MNKSAPQTRPHTSASTEDAAAVEDVRQQNINRAASLGLVTRLVAIGAQLGTVPLALAALGASEFGIWAAITSVVGLLMFLDFGVGNGAMGRITKAIASGDDEQVVSWVRHAYAILLTVAALVIAVVALAFTTGALQRIASFTDSFLSDHVTLLAAFFAAYALVVPCSFVQRLFFAYQKAGWASVIQLAFSLSYLAFVVCAYALQLKLEAFVMGYVLIMLAVYGASTWWGWSRLLPKATTAPSITWLRLKPLIKDSGLFFLLQVTVSLVYNSDQLVLTAFATPAEVAIYATTFKLFSIVMMVNGLLLGPMWPAITDAMARNEGAWMIKAYRRNRTRSLLATVALSLLIVVTGNWILAIWTNGKLQAPLGLLVLMAIWVLLEGYGQCMAMVLNAMHVIRLQVIVATTLLVVGLAAKVWLASHFGIFGPLIATCIAFVLIVAIPETYFVNKLLAEKT